MEETPKPIEGTWTLVAPDGRAWQAKSPLACAAAELRTRVPASVQLERILAAATPINWPAIDAELQDILYRGCIETGNTRDDRIIEELRALLRKVSEL